MLMLPRVAVLLLAVGALPAHSRGWVPPVGPGVIPKEGFVPNAEVATAIAEAVLWPVYGRATVVSERPFKATLDRGVWIVAGTVPCEDPPPGAVCPGGSAEVRISKKTGQILHMTHFQ
jgi:hypothetical protein